MKRRLDDIAMTLFAVVIVAVFSPMAIYQNWRWTRNMKAAYSEQDDDKG